MPQGGQRPAVEDPLGQGKDDALFLVEMPARVVYGREQQLPGFLEILGLLHVFQVLVNLLVFLQEGVALSELLKSMLQRPDKQLVLRVRMRLQ